MTTENKLTSILIKSKFKWALKRIVVRKLAFEKQPFLVAIEWYIAKQVFRRVFSVPIQA